MNSSRATTLLWFLFMWAATCGGSSTDEEEEAMEIYAHCLSWRFGVEANNIRNWKAVPEECIPHIQQYMLEGQYEKDLAVAIANAVLYAKEFSLQGDGMDAWVLDVDDTALSNLEYYRGKKFGGEIFDPATFHEWATRGTCPALRATLDLYRHLIGAGFKVFFITGRDESQRRVTEENLAAQGYAGWAGLILRGQGDRGISAVAFKSGKREELMRAGYRIWGNGGDQWSDITGSAVGARAFKLPNPMYFIS